MKRIYNFNAGPAMLPLEVLQEVQSELLDLQGSGMSILEMSHRAPIYEKINAEAEADIKELLGLGDDYCVLFYGRRRQPAVFDGADEFFGGWTNGGLCRDQ